jgi:hypothetical protein
LAWHNSAARHSDGNGAHRPCESCARTPRAIDAHPVPGIPDAGGRAWHADPAMAAPLRPLVRDPGREMFERFTERARRVLVLAQEEARFLEHNFIGTEHLLLGLVREADGVAAKALGELGIGLDDVRQRVKETIGPAGSPMTSSPPFTPRAKKVLELSLREALQLQHNYIGTEHILLGLVREGEGVAARVLVSLGADLSRVRQKVVDLLGTDPAAGLFEDPNDLRRSASPPRCGRCVARLAESARYRTIEVPPDEDEAGSGQGPVRATLPYCSFCGTVIGPPSECWAPRCLRMARTPKVGTGVAHDRTTEVAGTRGKATSNE